VQPEALQHRFCMAGQELELFRRARRLHEPHELHLVELVLPDQPAHVLAVRAGFAAEARRVSGVGDRKRSAVEDLVGVQVRDRDLRRGDQVEWAAIFFRALAVRFEQIRLELRQLPGAAQRLGLDQDRRVDLAVSVLFRVQIEHEADDRPLEPGGRAIQHGKARSGELGGALEIDDASAVPAQCSEVQKPSGRPHIRTGLSFRRAVRRRRMRHVRNAGSRSSARWPVRARSRAA
jgi:hypothetical protein